MKLNATQKAVAIMLVITIVSLIFTVRNVRMHMESISATTKLIEKQSTKELRHAAYDKWLKEHST